MGLSKPSVCTDTRTPHSRAVFPTVYLSKSWLLTRLAARERLAFVRLSAAKSAGRDTKRSPSPPSSGWGQFVRRIVVNPLPTPHLRPAILWPSPTPATPHLPPSSPRTLPNDDQTAPPQPPSPRTPKSQAQAPRHSPAGGMPPASSTPSSSRHRSPTPIARRVPPRASPSHDATASSFPPRSCDATPPTTSPAPAGATWPTTTPAARPTHSPRPRPAPMHDRCHERNGANARPASAPPPPPAIRSSSPAPPCPSPRQSPRPTRGPTLDPSREPSRTWSPEPPFEAGPRARPSESRDPTPSPGHDTRHIPRRPSMHRPDRAFLRPPPFDRTGRNSLPRHHAAIPPLEPCPPVRAARAPTTSARCPAEDPAMTPRDRPPPAKTGRHQAAA